MKLGREKRKWLLGLLAATTFALVGLVAFAVWKRGRTPTLASTPSEVRVDAPDDLFCDLYVPSPNSSWKKLQSGVGGAAGVLPTTLPGVLVALTNLDAQLDGVLDGSAPMFGAVAGDLADPSVVVAMKLIDPDRAGRVLAAGESANFAAREEAGMTRLVPNRPDRARRLELAITKNGYLLAARHAADLERLGSYVTRGLPARPLPSGALVIDLPRKALGSMLVPTLDALWKNGKAFLLDEDARMRKERGRAPDYGDPAGIVATLDGFWGSRSAILADLERVRVAVEVTEDATLIDVTLAPAAGGPARQWIDGMRIGDASAMLALPAASTLAVSMRDGESSRAEQAKGIEQAIATSLGPRLEHPERLHGVIEPLMNAREESLSLALGIDEPTGFFARMPVRDIAAAQTAVSGVFDHVRSEPWRSLFRVRDTTAVSEDVSGLGRVSRMAFGHAPFSVAWTTEEDRGKAIVLAAGSEPLVALKKGARPERTLAEEPALEHFKTAVGRDASMLIVAQPLRIDPKRANVASAPLGVALGRKGGSGFVHVEISDRLLREAGRAQLGF